jgi:cytosine deaminase
MAPPAEYRIDRVALPGRDGVHHLTLRGGVVAAIATAEQAGEARWLALPGLVNLHAHADRAYAATSFRPRSFADALAAAARARADFTVSDVQERARRFFERSICHGVTRIRTHTDVDPVVELRSMDGVSAARADVTGRRDVDIIAFSTSRNDLADTDSVLRLKRAIERAPDILGASLNASADPERALTALLDLAEQTGLPIDLHLDEHLEPDKMLAGAVADAVIARGLQGRVTLSHLCALSTLEASAAHHLIERIARAGIMVIAQISRGRHSSAATIPIMTTGGRPTERSRDRAGSAAAGP